MFIILLKIIYTLYIVYGVGRKFKRIIKILFKKNINVHNKI